MKTPLFFCSIALTLSCSTNAELVSGYNKAIEIYNESEVPEATVTTIMAIQGEGWSSPFITSGNESEGDYQVTGIITAIQAVALGSHLPTGFFLQDADGDGNPNTSDAIFVQRNSVSDVTVGNRVTVQGKVYENHGWTQLSNTYIHHIEETEITIEPVALRRLDSDESFSYTLERHEGMLIELDQETDMRVTRTFGFDYGSYRNNMVLAQERVNLHPNQQNVPGSIQAIQQAEQNRDRRLFVESFEKAANGVIPWYPTFLTPDSVPMTDGTTTSNNYIRINDTVDGLQGVLGYSYDEFRLYVTNEANGSTFIHNSARTTTPDVADGDLKVATFNVLNYFNSPFGGDENPLSSSRGAESQDEFERQGDKIAKAIIAMDADIIGLMEIENNGFGENSAINHLVTKINALLEDENDHYQYIAGEDEYIGTDAIANQVIFRPAKVQLETYRVISMPQQRATEGEDRDNYQRDAITPTFTINNSDQKLTVSVNHFKSKGSTCWEDVNLQNKEDADMQGSCENFRVSAAQHLGTEMAAIDGYKLILGDLNSYGSEDPVLLLTELPEGYSVTPARDTFIGEEVLHGAEPENLTQSFGYVDIVQAHHPDLYSYSYSDTLGSLDYILADKATVPYVADATEWNINASESSLVDYSAKYSGDLVKYSDPYRSSDHDPAIAVLQFSGNKPVQVIPPLSPVNLPQDIPQTVESVALNTPFSVVMLLTDLGDFELHVGDRARLVATPSRASARLPATAATARTNTNYVELTEEIISQGWVTLSAQIDEAGNHEVTKVIEGYGGTYTSEAMAVTAKYPNLSGGTTAPLAVMILTFIGVIRRFR